MLWHAMLSPISPQDHGSPVSLSSVTTMTIRVKDADDQNPVFTKEVYKASVSESAKLTVSSELLLMMIWIHRYDMICFVNKTV